MVSCLLGTQTHECLEDEWKNPISYTNHLKWLDVGKKTEFQISIKCCAYVRLKKWCPDKNQTRFLLILLSPMLSVSLFSDEKLTISKFCAMYFFFNLFKNGYIFYSTHDSNPKNCVIFIGTLFKRNAS